MPGSCAILQSAYIPWKGYFDLINLVDEFVIYDSVQYTRRSWRNRNRIKTPNGTRWLTVPVRSKGNYLAKIEEIEVLDPSWASSHWSALSSSYSRAPYYGKYKSQVAPLYLQNEELRLSSINQKLIRAICQMLGIETRITVDRNYELTGDRNWRLINICKQVGATVYYSGPTARCYIDEELFRQEGIEVVWMDYSGYPEYNQLYEPFDHYVTVLDLLFNTGPEARAYMKSFRDSKM